MTYYIKKNPLGSETHIFDDATCFCDGEEHIEYAFVAKGLRKNLTTCKLCISKIGWYVKKELGKILNNM